MILSLLKKSPLSSSGIKQRLTKRHLLDSSLEKAQIYYQMKKFIDFDIGDHIIQLEENQKAKVIKYVLTAIDTSNKEQNKILWAKTFAIHAFFKLFVRNFLQNQIGFLTLIEQISSIKTSIISNKSNEQKGLLNRSLSKIKRSFSTSSFKNIFSTQNHSTQKKPNGLNDLQRQIFLQYVLYLEKILHDWPELEQFVEPKKYRNMQRMRKKLTQEQKTNLIWKIFNIFQKLSKISKDHLRINKLMADYSNYFYSMMNFITEDVEILYNPIIDELRARIKLIRQGEVLKCEDLDYGSRLNPEISIEKIMEVHSMVQELGNVNQVVLYVFFGSFHFNYLYKNQRPSNFVSINDEEFDQIYKAAREISGAKSKLHERSQSQEKERSWLAKNHNKNDGPLSIQERFEINKSKFTAANKEDSSRMKAVNYKSLKLREIQNETLKKQ